MYRRVMKKFTLLKYSYVTLLMSGLKFCNTPMKVTFQWTALKARACALYVYKYSPKQTEATGKCLLSILNNFASNSLN